MAKCTIVERAIAPGFFDIQYLTGAQTPAEIRLLEGLRGALREIEEKGQASDVPSVLSRLRNIAEEGLVADNHCAALWLTDFTLFDLEFHGRSQSERTSVRPIWVGKYYRTELHVPKNKLTDMRYSVLKDVNPPTEYLDFIDHYNELRASLLTISDLEGESQKRSSTHWWTLTERKEKYIHLNERLQSYFQRLAYAGIAGLGSDAIDTARKQFANLEAEIVRRESSRIKNKYVTRLGIVAFLCFSGFVAIYTAIRMLPFDEKEYSVIWRFREFFLLAAGCSIGSWLSFAIRHPRFSTLLDLEITESDQLSPKNRVLFTISLTTVIGLILQSGMLRISINGFSSFFQFNGVRALLLGLFCGISEIVLSEIVGGRAEDVIKRLAVQKSIGS
jgi:hypothetical protein